MTRAVTPATSTPAVTPAVAGAGERVELRGGDEVTALIDQLTQQAAAWARGARASSTWAAYDRDWARFAAWCTARGVEALPADPRSVAAYLADLAPAWRPAVPGDDPAWVVDGQVKTAEGLRPATIARRLAAIAVAHRAAGHPNPAAHEAVRATMAGIRRHRGVAPARRRTAARTTQIEAMVSGLDPAGDPAEARDAALILLGYTAALRRSDLAALDLDDLTVTAEGLEVRVRRSKTDQHGDGVSVGVAGDEHGRCPAADAWTAWVAHLRAAGVWRGPAFRPVHRSRAGTATIRPTRLSGRSINTIVARRAAAAGLDGDYGSHSLRRGLATEAIAAGVPEHAVMRHGRWRSATTMRSYVAEAERFAADNPTRHLGLGAERADR